MKDIKGWIKKIIAFILDIIVLWFVIGIFEILILITISSFIDKTYLIIFEKGLDLIFLFLYFYVLPEKFGNTPARKILRIKDKFHLFWTWPFMRSKDKFTAEHLKKNEILKVSPKDGYWSCPSCNERNKEMQDVCSNCGQEIEKWPAQSI